MFVVYYVVIKNVSVHNTAKRLRTNFERKLCFDIHLCEKAPSKAYHCYNPSQDLITSRSYTSR
jgi:hypothetical protein